MLSSSPCSSCTPGRSSSPTEGWCASPSRCSFAFAGRVVVIYRVSAFLLAHFNRAVCLFFSRPAGAASVAHACNRCSCHSFCSCSENKLRLSVARTREQQPFITSFWRISRSRAVVLQPRKGLALLEEEAAHRRCPEHAATA